MFNKHIILSTLIILPEIKVDRNFFLHESVRMWRHLMRGAAKTIFGNKRLSQDNAPPPKNNILK